jgi:hypothetical protein
VILEAPYLPSCSDCLKWVHGSDWKATKARDGSKLPRVAGNRPPCFTCPKGPVPHERELSDRNWQAVELYLQCKAGRPIPDDPIVHRNHGLLRMVEDAVDRSNAAAVRRVAEALRMRGS